MKSANKKITKLHFVDVTTLTQMVQGLCMLKINNYIVKKGYFTFKEFYKEYKPHGDKQVLIHFRIKTHGPIDKNNCHPFLVNNSLGFIHNGIITGYGRQ